MIEWDKSLTRELRLRLGWTQADLARRLNIQVHQVIDWELGKINPNECHISNIEFLMRQAEICSDEVHLAPLIECELKNQNLNQVDRHEIATPLPDLPDTKAESK